MTDYEKCVKADAIVRNEIKHGRSYVDNPDIIAKEPDGYEVLEYLKGKKELSSGNLKWAHDYRMNC